MPFEKKERRYKILQISFRDFMSIFVSEPIRHVTVHRIKLPPDVNVVTSWVDQSRSGYKVLLESSEFEDIPPGEEFPEIAFQFQSYITQIDCNLEVHDASNS